MPTTVSDVSRPLPPFDRPPQPREAKKAFYTKAFIALIAAGVVAGCASRTGSLTPQGGAHTSGLRQASNISRALPAASPTPVPADQAACSGGGLLSAACSVKKNGKNGPSASPSGGLTPAQLRSTYGLPAFTGTATPSGPLIAIVAAYDDSAAENDLAAYRKQFGLPVCSKNNGCFQKVVLKPDPGSPPAAPKPPGNSPDATTWNDEISLDLAMASVACPNCRLLLIEAVGQDLDSLADGVNAAASYNPVAISNSWGVTEGGGNVPNIDADAQAAFNHPGIAITASAGDLGAGQTEFPASSPYVTAVGGTSLAQDATTARGWTETVWNGSGNGCSIMIAPPAWQTAPSACSGRSIPDISMLADSALGVAVYSSAEKGWVVLGGTSVGAPFVAGLYGAAADYGAGTIGAPALYAHLGALNPVAGTTGSPNGLAGF